MELFRQDYELRLGPNWGKIIFDRLKEREEEINLTSNSPKVRSKKVQALLENYPVIYGPLDASNILSTLTEDDQCDFFERFRQCEILVLRSWTFLSDKVLRCISLTMGETLTDVDFSGSAVDVGHFEILYKYLPLKNK